MTLGRNNHRRKVDFIGAFGIAVASSTTAALIEILSVANLTTTHLPLIL